MPEYILVTNHKKPTMVPDLWSLIHWHHSAVYVPVNEHAEQSSEAASFMVQALFTFWPSGTPAVFITPYSIVTNKQQ